MADPTGSGARPGVSYVMPVLNDVTHVKAAVESLLAQDYDGPFDVVIALAPSIDGTAELLADLQAADPRIRVIENPVGSTPSGLNLAIRASANPIVVRVDAHSVLPPEYTRIAVETILATGAANVGGIMDAQGTSPFEVAVARAYGSRLGLGGTRLHRGGEEGPAETVYLGVFRREPLVAAGLFAEDIKRGQDWELNRRLRSRGGVVWFSPRLRVVYRPRPSLGRLARQFLSTGIWRGELARRFPAANGPRYFAPPLAVAAITIGLLAGVAGIVQDALGIRPWLLVGFAIPLVYLIAVVVSTVLIMRGAGGPATRWFLIVLPCIHIAWGIGFVVGFAALARNITAYTGR